MKTSSRLYILLVIIALTAAACPKKQFISVADVTLRTYRDYPNLKIFSDEWQRCAEYYGEKEGVKLDRAASRKAFCEGKALQVLDQGQKAMALFEEAAELDPDWALPYQAMGSIELEVGNFEKARDMFQKAYDLDPLWISPLADLGVAYHHMEKPLLSLQSFEKAIVIDPSQAFLHSNLGNTLSLLGRYDEAVKAHLQAIHLEPMNPMFYMNLAATLEETGDLENQIWVQEKLKDLLPESQKIICFIKMARLLDKTGNPEEALACYKKALALKPGKKAVQDEIKQFYFSHKLFAHLIDFIMERSKEGCKVCAQECYDLGNILLREGNLEGAQKSYEAALALLPGWIEPDHNLGIVHYRKHNYTKAIECFERVLQSQPDDASSLLNMGMAVYRTGDAAGAEKWIVKSIEVDPDQAVAHSNLGEVYRFQGKTKKAAGAHARAAALAPDSCFISAQQARFLVDSKKLKEAAEKLDQAPPEDCAAFHMARALLRLDKKDPDGAMDEIEKALSLDDTLAEARAVRGLILMKKGDNAKASEDLAAALCMEERIAGEKRYKAVIQKLKITPGCKVE
jgi:tetratricopeptide (TPR) repeat protein